LGEEHTRKYWKTEQFLPKVSDQLTYHEWKAIGKRSAIDYARERMEKILASHQAKPLTPSQEQEIEKILKEAREYYKKQGKL
jgi:trimethylamine--corrinoid protein Co-methyltransferase